MYYLQMVEFNFWPKLLCQLCWEFICWWSILLNRSCFLVCLYLAGKRQSVVGHHWWPLGRADRPIWALWPHSCNAAAPPTAACWSGSAPSADAGRWCRRSARWRSGGRRLHTGSEVTTSQSTGVSLWSPPELTFRLWVNHPPLVPLLQHVVRGLQHHCSRTWAEVNTERADRAQKCFYRGVWGGFQPAADSEPADEF